MRKILFASKFGILILLISCNQKVNKKEVEKNIIKPIISETIKKEIEKPENKETFHLIENDSITHHWETELKLLSKKYKGFSIKTELSKNDHDETQTDTIKTLTFDKSEIVVYSTNNFYAIWSANIKNPELPIWNYVKVGMKKYQLEKTLSTRLKSDTIKLGNLEQTSLFEFIFKDGILNQVEFEGYVD